VELYALHVFSTVVSERSFSRAAEKLFRTQPAVSLAVQRLESEVGEKLIDRDMRGAKELVLTDAGRVVFEHARRFRNLEQELTSALAELRDRSAGRLTIGANESSTLYLLPHIERYRGRFPKIKVQIRRSQSSASGDAWACATPATAHNIQAPSARLISSSARSRPRPCARTAPSPAASCVARKPGEPRGNPA